LEIERSSITCLIAQVKVKVKVKIKLGWELTSWDFKKKKLSKIISF
jgi:hypothetical protein